MSYDSLTSFLAAGAKAIGPGPVALILAEDDVALGATLRHYLRLGFERIILFAPPRLVPDLPDGPITLVAHPTGAPGFFAEIVTAVCRTAQPGTWVHYAFNGEFLFYPFCASREIGEMLAFHAEERRSAMFTYVVDLYSDDLDAASNGVSIENAFLDRTGYYGLARKDPGKNWEPKDRQLDMYGGLRWRFEEHVPHEQRRIDRIALFRARPDLELRADHTLNDDEMNTVACPWHNNLTAALCSFRAAKALRTNPGSRDSATNFMWENSIRFDWNDQQLLDLGLIEPGQWF